ncbi:hypothetical protein BUALT_Bualt01G0180600 [Buddleja alternifolia]|uniref:Peptidase A1 domain-containing protein n=1 Tax=Buddleja alternifolia TaxID=168488 RepID=A0AAV6YF24_9LAMI|nr:hypothetical protein BUALT_Bualt01G0180600 [Buddleja alternifolia]
MSKIMILKSILIAYISLVSILSIFKFPSTEASTTGFTIDLIHRDSPQSPSYDSSLTPSQRLAKALRRSFTRIHRFQAKKGSQQSPEPDVINASGEYFLKYSIGTPPVPSLGVADTGSDVTWTQCQPCIKCFKQELPFFRPNASSTYKRIPCNSPSCRTLPDTTCSKTRKNCLYSASYGDGSFTYGEVATDTITLGSTRGKMVSFPNIVVGCGFKNGILFDGGESGIVGLGGGKASLVRQLGSIAQGKFSYCLLSLSDNSNSSKLKFGANAVVSGKGVVSTPLVSKKPETFYYLTLIGISVGKQRLEFNYLGDSKANQEGNIIIDSGTTLTLLPSNLYGNLLKVLKSAIKLKQIPDPSGVLDLCYFSLKDIHIPDVTVHFKGADVKLKAENVFVRVSETAVCLAVQAMQDIAIYGNIAQVNFLVGYDLEKRTVSFKPTDCGKS